MEPVNCHLGLGQLPSHPAEKRRRHVTDHFENLFRIPVVLFQERLEFLDGFLAFARRHEQHRLVATLHVDEDGHVVMAPLAGGLIQSDGLDC